MNDLMKKMIEAGHVNTRINGDLTLYNYSRTATYEQVWNDATRLARGYIRNHVTGETVAWPIGKFFNWGEHTVPPTSPVVSVTTKVDGSCGILYRNDGFKIATRGSFESEQAIWATEFLNSGQYDLQHIADELTLVFEIVYPDNRIVIDYGDTEDLVLLFARNRFTGEEVDYMGLCALADKCGFTVVERFGTTAIDELIALSDDLPSSEEGWVILLKDGQRVKIKGADYCEVHRIISNFTTKKIRQAWIEGLTETMRQTLPEEFWDDFDSTITMLEEMLAAFIISFDETYEAAPKEDRKEFAQWTLSHAKNISGLMFSRMDGHDLTLRVREAATVNYREEFISEEIADHTIIM